MSTKKIYTKTGDKGTTSLIDGSRVPKSDPRIELNGCLDALDVHLGAMRTPDEPNSEFILRAQCQVHVIMAHVTCTNDEVRETLPRFDIGIVYDMECEIDRLTAQMPPLVNFVIPGHVDRTAHKARVTCRAAERALVPLKDCVDDSMFRFINRLSDYLFTVARYTVHRLGDTENVWRTRASAEPEPEVPRASAEPSPEPEVPQPPRRPRRFGSLFSRRSTGH